jgi:hypothetical protein
LLVQFCLSAAGMLVVVYLEPHYAAPLVATVLALQIQAMRHLRQWKLFNRPVGIGLTRVIVLAVLVNVPFYVAQTVRNHHRAQADNQSWGVFRVQMVKQLESTPGLHLAIVRYAPDHIVHNEWVYNAADIDHAKIVWAREIPGQDVQPLLDYFRDRTVWLVEADKFPPRVRPYTR